MEKTTELEKNWLENAKLADKTIVLPEAGFSKRILDAGLQCAKEKIAKIVLLTTDDEQLKDVEENENLRIVNCNTSELRELLAAAFYEKRKEKGLTLEDAYKLIGNPVYFGTLMVDLSLADGLVAGAEISTAETFKPAFQIIKGKTPKSKISSFFVMIREQDDVEEKFILSDCGVTIDPSVEEVVEIAKLSSQSARIIGGIEEPKVALLSYSTMGSADGEDAEKMRKAKAMLDTETVDFDYDGEMQLDAAIVESVGKLKAPNSCVAGRANVLVFPNLSAGNIGYKLMQRFGGFKAIGPIAQGMRKPINDVSRGATVDEIVKVIAITAIQD